MAKTYRDAVLENVVWPSIQAPRVSTLNGKPILSFPKKEISNRLERLKSCLVVRVMGDNPSVFTLREWGKHAWRIRRELQVRRLSKDLFLFLFLSASIADRVLREGSKKWQGGRLLLDLWHPTAGCRWAKRERDPRMIWLHGLPLHLWGMKTFEKVGELCGLLGFEIKDPASMEWVA